MSNIPATPIIKIYEALGAIADERVALVEAGASVMSSSRKKTYRVRYHLEKNAIESNDNGTFWRGYIGYPAVAYLMLVGRITYDIRVKRALGGIPWKDLNVRFGNNYQKTLMEIAKHLHSIGVAPQDVETEVGRIANALNNLNVTVVRSAQYPPEGY
jgi:hypothetical protein